MSLSREMARRMRSTFGGKFASRDDAARFGYLLPRDVTDRAEYAGTNPELFFDLGCVARGEDAAGQTSTVLRSNYRRLLADFPDAFTYVSFTNVNSLGAFANDLDHDLAELLLGLADVYLLYDEGDLSALESDEVGAAWDEYLRWDLRCELTEAEQGALHALPDAAVRDAFYGALHAIDYYPEHDGLDVRWDTARCVEALRLALAAVAA